MATDAPPHAEAEDCSLASIVAHYYNFERFLRTVVIVDSRDFGVENYRLNRQARAPSAQSETSSRCVSQLSSPSADALVTGPEHHSMTLSTADCKPTRLCRADCY